MKRIYILYNNNNYLTASLYGVGTYMQQLIQCFHHLPYCFTIVNLFAGKEEVCIEKNETYEEIFIPFKGKDEQSTHNYFSAIPYMLHEFIPDDTSGELIFHLHSMKYTLLALNLHKIYINSKVVLTIHYTDWSFRLEGDINKLMDVISQKDTNTGNPFQTEIISLIEEEKKLIDQCDRIICIANHSADSLVRIHGIEKDKIKVINNGLADSFTTLAPSEKAKIRKKYYIREDTCVILFAGRLKDIKGVPHLLKAFHKALENHPDIHLFLAGEGDFNKWITESSGFAAKVSFLGYIGKDTLSDYYRIADMGIVPSLHEEFGYVAIEMMMHQLPVIVNNTTGLKEIVEHEESGLVYNFSEANEEGISQLAEFMIFYMQQPEKAKESGEYARKRFLEKYSLSVFNRKMLAFYDEL